MVGLFELGRDSLEDLFTKKMSQGNSRSLQTLVDEAGLPWLWQSGRSVFHDEHFDKDPDDYLIELVEYYGEKIENEKIVLGDVQNKELKVVNTKARGTSRYSAELIERKENLLNWIEEGYKKENIIFASFTLSSKRVKDIKESFDVYKDAVNNIMSKIQQKQHLGERPTYLWAIEPHENGYPHLHIIFFENYISNFDDVARWWSEQFTDGRADRQGVDYQLISKTRGRKRVAQDIAKYVVKNLAYNDFDEDEKQISKNKRLLWLGLLWLSGRRSWSYSRKLGKIMRFGLVKSRTNSIDERVNRIAGFVLNEREFVYLGTYGQVEIDKRKGKGTWTFEKLYKEKFGVEFSDDSGRVEVESSVSYRELNCEVEDLGA